MPRVVSFGLMALVTLTVPVFGAGPKDVKVPDTAAGKRLVAYLQAFNSGRDEVRQRFVAENFDKDFLAGQPPGIGERYLENALKETGGLVLHGIEESEPYRLTALVRTKGKEEWTFLTVEVSPKPPHLMLQPPRASQAPAPRD